MKIKQARAIVGKMVLWSMISQGIDTPEKPDKITEDLMTLLKANRIVERANKRGKERIDRILEEKGSWEGRRKVSTTIADRGIAALYVAANFPGDSPQTADVLAKHGNNLVFCLNESTIKEEEL